MKSREVVTRDNYKRIVLKRMIILCWILLAVCFVVKVFGGNFFNIVCQNERFTKVCVFVDKNVWMQYIIGCISTLFLQTLYLLAISRHLWFTRKREVVIVLISMLIGVGLRLCSATIGFVFDIYQYLIMPFLIKDKYKFCVKSRRVILAVVLTIIFQIISLFVKNLEIFTVTNNNFLIAFIYNIDVSIMIIMYYLYSNKIKESAMGLFSGWLWGKSPKTLQKMRATRIAKIESLKTEVAEIDKELTRKNEN